MQGRTHTFLARVEMSRCQGKDSCHHHQHLHDTLVTTEAKKILQIQKTHYFLQFSPCSAALQHQFTVKGRSWEEG